MPDPEKPVSEEAQLEAEVQGKEARLAEILSKVDAVIEALLAKQEAGEELTAAELLQIMTAKGAYDSLVKEIANLTDSVWELVSKGNLRGFPIVGKRIFQLFGNVSEKGEELKKKVEKIGATVLPPDKIKEALSMGVESLGLPTDHPAHDKIVEVLVLATTEKEALQAEVADLKAKLAVAESKTAAPTVATPLPEPARAFTPPAAEPTTPGAGDVHQFTAAETAQVRAAAEATPTPEDPNAVRLTRMKEAAALVGARFTNTGALQVSTLHFMRAGSANQEQFLKEVRVLEGANEASNIEKAVEAKKKAVNLAASQLIDQAKFDIKGVAKMKSDEFLRLFAKPPQTLKDGEKWLIRSLALFASEMGWIDGAMIPAASSAESTEFGKSQVAALKIALEQLKSTVMKDGADNLEDFFDVNEDKFKLYFSKLTPTTGRPAAASAAQPVSQPASAPPLTLPALESRPAAPATSTATEASAPSADEAEKFKGKGSLDGVDLTF